MGFKILFSNIGYARGIDGSLRQHVFQCGSHLYRSQPQQKQVLNQVKSIILKEKPDICCFVEIEKGSFFTSYYNQIEALTDSTYCYYNITGKYGESLHSRLPFHKGKSSAFIARHPLPYKNHHFEHGAKKLVYEVFLPGGISLLFAHFSLRRPTRQKQFEQMNRIVSTLDNEAIIMADFNILKGIEEIDPLLRDRQLVLLNRDDEHTFFFHTYKFVLDLCLCSPALAERMTLKIIPQPFSDHAALLATVK